MAKGERVYPSSEARAAAGASRGPTLFRPGLLRRYLSANDNPPAPGAVLRTALKVAGAAAAFGALLWFLS